MTMFLREAFALCQSIHPDVKVGFSTFCESRPKNVPTLQVISADVKSMKTSFYVSKA